MSEKSWLYRKVEKDFTTRMLLSSEKSPCKKQNLLFFIPWQVMGIVTSMKKVENVSVCFIVF